MGESKRRTRLAPNYGKVPNLSTTTLKERHSESVLEELFSDFSLKPTHLYSLLAFNTTQIQAILRYD